MMTLRFVTVAAAALAPDTGVDGRTRVHDASGCVDAVHVLLVAPASGELELAVNDAAEWLFDNSGGYTVALTP